MSSQKSRRDSRGEFLLSAILIASGLAVTAMSVMQLSAQQHDMLRVQMAQTAPPSQDTPTIPAGKDNGPAESKPGGTRPTTPAPEPATPDADAQKAGAKPALPPAPAEKMGEPVQK